MFWIINFGTPNIRKNRAEGKNFLVHHAVRSSWRRTLTGNQISWITAFKFQLNTLCTSLPHASSFYLPGHLHSQEKSG